MATVKSCLQQLNTELEQLRILVGGRPTWCLMCNGPYGDTHDSTFIDIKAKCGCIGPGKWCAEAELEDTSTVSCDKPCRLNPLTNDCYKCQREKLCVRVANHS